MYAFSINTDADMPLTMRRLANTRVTRRVVTGQYPVSALLCISCFTKVCNTVILFGIIPKLDMIDCILRPNTMDIEPG